MSESNMFPHSPLRRSARISARLSARLSSHHVNPNHNLSATSSTPPTRTIYLMGMDERMEKWTAELLTERLNNMSDEKSLAANPNENDMPPPPHNSPVVHPVVEQTTSPAHSTPSSATLVEEIPISYLPETPHHQNSGDGSAPKSAATLEKSVSKLEKQLRNARSQITNIESAFKDATKQLQELTRANKELEQQICELQKTENEDKTKKQLILQILNN